MAVARCWTVRTWSMTVAFAVCVACGVGGLPAWCAAPAAPAAVATQPAELATQPAASSVQIVELRGEPAELGKAHGEKLGGEIRLLLRDYFDRFLASRPGPVDPESLLKVAAAFFEPQIRPEHREEIRAAAAAASVDPKKFLLAQCFTDLTLVGGCSTITLPAAASSDGIARFGRNLDFLSLDVLDRHAVLLVVHPKNRYAFAAVTYPGLVGVLSGMNEHGLTLANMEVPRHRRPPDGMPYMLLYRTLLEQCKTVNEAIALLEKTPRQSANNLMLVDASGDRAVAEITPEKVTIRRAPETAVLISTNHQRGDDQDSPGRCRRYDFLHDEARRQFGQLTEAKVEDLLAGAAQKDATIQSMVFEPANRVLYLAAGAEAPKHDFARIDLKPYFR